MRQYQVFFVFLRVMVILQGVLILFKKQTRDSNIYVILDALSKISVGGFLYLFFLFHTIDGLEYGDTLVLQFAGILILLDVNYKDLLRVVRLYYPSLPKISLVEG